MKVLVDRTWSLCLGDGGHGRYNRVVFHAEWMKVLVDRTWSLCPGGGGHGRYNRVVFHE